MNWKKLLSIGALTMFSASIATGQGTAPTIVQGDYISNVFGNSNFIKNPNAKLNNKDVTVSNATVTRSTTTPLVATSEFLVTTSTATGSATWSTRTFDSGMKGQNCEARFSYRGFSVGSTTAQILQGANVVAQLTLTPSTDPRIASINFPCGDLSSATTFRLQQATASLTGTNEIGGIYVGLATNMANVAQAEAIVRVGKTGTQTITPGTEQTLVYDTETLDVYNEYNPTNGVFTAKRAGILLVNASVLFDTTSWTAGNVHQISVFKNGNVVCKQRVEAEATRAGFMNNEVTCQVSLNVGDTVTVPVFQNTTGNVLINLSPQWTYSEIYRFPSSSELVVTPERQNVWGSIDGTGLDSTTSSTSYVTPTGFSISGTKGKCLADGTNLACKISTLPPGTYKVDVTMPYFAVAGSAAQNCYVQITDNKGAVDAATAQAGNAGAGLNDGISHVSRTFTYTSVQTDIIFTLKHKQAAGTGGSCGIYTASGPRYWQMNVIPLDQPSNSALYVEGPVKAAATGAAIPAGYQGETKTASCTARVSASKTNGSYTDLSGNGVGGLAAITLEPGVWKIIGAMPVGWLQWSSGANTAGWGSLSIRDGSNAIIEEQAFTFAGDFGANWYTSSFSIGGTTITGIVRPTTSTTYKLSVVPSVYSGAPVWTDFSIGCDVRSAKITAVRIN